MVNLEEADLTVGLREDRLALAGLMQLNFILLCVVAGRKVERVVPNAPRASWGQAAPP